MPKEFHSRGWNLVSETGRIAIEAGIIAKTFEF
jgi:hypothetical protein